MRKMYNFQKPETTDTTDNAPLEKNDYPRTSSKTNRYLFTFANKNIIDLYLWKDGVVVGAVIVFTAYFLLMMSFCSPYWMVSYPETNSKFKNMGLWQYCFKDYIYPNFQIFHKFTGCHDIFGHVSYKKTYLLLNVGWFEEIFLFTGILCDQRISASKLANGRPDICHFVFYHYLY